MAVLTTLEHSVHVLITLEWLLRTSSIVFAKFSEARI